MVDNFYSTYQDDRIYGKLELSYDITKDIKVIGRFGGDYTNIRPSASNHVLFIPKVLIRQLVMVQL